MSPEGQLILDDHTSMLDLYDHPFRATYGYERWANDAGLLSSTALETLMPLTEEGLITQADEDMFSTYSNPVIRQFNEFGYNSRASATAIVTTTDAWALMKKAIGPEATEGLKDRPAVIRASLLKLAKDSFIWGRTGQPRGGVKFGDDSEPESLPELKDVFFPDDIDEFARVVGDKVAERAMPLLRRQTGWLGRLTLRRKDKGSSPNRRNQLTRDQSLRFTVGATAASSARRFITGEEL
jgi:hypothetical protein